MIGSASVPGFYGKIPSHGDFVTRRLPRQFIEPWDQWLQSGMNASREQLGESWLDTFLYSPIWQFAIAPGVCGDEAWAGVMMPSVDRVGRYFPLTLAAKIGDRPLAGLFEPACGWFEALSELALSSLDYDFDLDSFDAHLSALRLDAAGEIPLGRAAPQGADMPSVRRAFHVRLGSIADTPRALTETVARWQGAFPDRLSFWRAVFLENQEVSLLVCDGMPPVNAYAGFLSSRWPNRPWNLSSLDWRTGITAVDAAVDKAAETCARTNGGTQGNAAAPSEQITRERVPYGSLPPSGGKWAMESAGLSVVGMRRKLNEDAILERPDAGLWAVADGMGGHSAGDVASQALVTALSEMTLRVNSGRIQEQVESCLQSVNRALVAMAERRGYGQIIGSTIVVLLITGNEFRYVWAGDSRLYRYRQGVLEQLTQDHSMSSETSAGNGDSSNGFAVPVHENVITRAVGAEPLLELDAGGGEIADGDLFILCSDGLIKELADGEIASICSSGSPHEIVQRLVGEAEARGGRDNISVVGVAVGHEKL